MKRFVKIICLVLCALLAFPMLAACDPEVQPEPSKLTYSGKALTGGTVGVSYSASVATAEGSDDIEYALDIGNHLPTGLTLSKAGEITGVPSQAVASRNIVVVASADEFEDVKATFTISVEKGSFTYAGTELPDATELEYYSASVAFATGITGATFTYALKEESTFPSGLALTAAGVISGYPEKGSKVEEHQFTIVATANANYNTVEAVFTLTVLEGEGGGYNELDELVFISEATLPDGTVGIPYNFAFSVDGTAPQNISYSVEFNGIGFPEGIDLNAFGIISGTPLDSTIGVDEDDTEKILAFTILANAEGYDEISQTFYLKVEDPLVETDRFHAILFDLTYRGGNGWSSNDSGLDMIRVDERGDLGGFLGYLHGLGQVLKFEIYSSAATTGNLSIRIASEMGAVEVYDDEYVIRVNGGDPCSYNEIITGDDNKTPLTQGGPDDFITVNIGEIELIEGLNIITFEMMDNSFFCGQRFGNFEFDYMEIETDATLSWRPKTYNLVAKELD